MSFLSHSDVDSVDDGDTEIGESDVSPSPLAGDDTFNLIDLIEVFLTQMSYYFTYL